MGRHLVFLQVKYNLRASVLSNLLGLVQPSQQIILLFLMGQNLPSAGEFAISYVFLSAAKIYRVLSSKLATKKGLSDIGARAASAQSSHIVC